MTPGRGEHPQGPQSNEGREKKGEQPLEARAVDIGGLDEGQLQKLKTHWQPRWRQPGARGLINRIDRRLELLEREHLETGKKKEEGEEAGAGQTVGEAVGEAAERSDEAESAEDGNAQKNETPIPEPGPLPQTFEMPAGPNAAAVVPAEEVDEASLPDSLRRQQQPHPKYPFLSNADEVRDANFEEGGADAAKEKGHEEETRREPDAEPRPEAGAEPSLDERIARAEAAYHRSLYDLPVDASDDELRQRMDKARVQRLGLPEHADPEYIARAEEQWQREVAALPEITDPHDEAQLAPYYSHFHIEPGTGYEAIQRAMRAARLERERLPAPFAAEEPSAAGPKETDAGNALKEGGAVSGETEDAQTRTVESGAQLWRDIYEGASPGRLAEWLGEDSAKLHTRQQDHAQRRERGEAILGLEARLLDDEQAKFRALLEVAREKGVDVSAYEAPTAPETPGAVPPEIHEETGSTSETLHAGTQAESATAAAPEGTEAAGGRAEVGVEHAPAETAEQTALRLIDSALSGVGVRERWSSRADRVILQRCQKVLRNGEPLTKTNADVWRALTAIYSRRLEQKDHPDLALAGAESYREFLRRGGVVPAEKSVLLLDALARHDSPESAMRLYRDICRAAESVAQVTEGAEGPVRNPLADEVGEAWLGKLKEQIQSAEQRDDRAHPDPEELGRLQGVVEGPALPETLADRLTAATDALGLLQGRRERGPVAPETEAGSERPTSLAQRRSAYARGLQSQSRIFGRTSQVQLKQFRTEYQGAIQEQVAAKVEEIKSSMSRLPDGGPISPEAQAQVQEALVDIVLSSRFEEEAALKESMRSSTEKTATTRFKHFWKKHPRARMAIGAALFGATTASAATGNILAAGIFQSMRTVVSGASMTMTTEAIWEKSRERWGDTKKLSRRSMAGLSDEELERRIAAHTVASASFAPDYYERQLGRGRTIELLNEEYHRRKDEVLKAEIQRMREAGHSTDDIAVALILHSMNDETGFHGALEKRKEVNRKDAVKKWSVAIGTGFIAGALTGALGAGRIARAAEAATAREAAGQAGGAAKRKIIESVLAGEQLGGTEAGNQAAAQGAEAGGEAGARAAGAAGARAAEAGSQGAPEATEHVATGAEKTAHGAEAAAKSVEAYAGQAKDAVINKGEGIEHALRRQLEAMPEKFGFHGDAADKAAIHEWSGGEAHRIALREGFASADGGETRVAFDADHPTRFTLQADGHVGMDHAETYVYGASAEQAAAATTEGVAEAAQSTGSETARAAATQAMEQARAAAPETIADMTTLKEMSPEQFGLSPDLKVAAPDGIGETFDSYAVHFDGKDLHIGKQIFTLEGASTSSVDEPTRTFFTFGEQPTNEVDLSIENGHLHLRACAENGAEANLEIAQGGKIVAMDGVATADGTPVDQLVNGEIFAEARSTESALDQNEVLENALKKSAESSITLSKHGKEALSAFRTSVEAMAKYDRGGMIGIRQAIINLPARDVLTNAESIKHVIDQQQGGTHDVAVQYTKALTKLFRAIPKNKIHSDETIGSILNRLAGALDQEQASAIG